MGCGASKLEEQEAVTHCRARSLLLAEAIQYRYEMADAHRAYTQALQSVGPALFSFLNAAQAGPAPPSPLLTLPTQRKGEPSPPGPVPVPIATATATVSANRPSHSRSHSGGSHIHFSDSESEHDSHIHFHSDEEDGFEPGPSSQFNPTIRYNMNYARSQPPPPSVSFEQRPPVSQDTVYPSYNEPHMYQPESSGLYPPYPPYPSYNSYSGYGEMGGGFNGYFGSSSMPSDYPPPREPAPREDEPPPAPPSPPQVSTWDFLNPFESYDTYYAAAPPYTPSRSSKELREEEGIPDLEEEQEVVKAAYGDEKAPPFASGKGKVEKGEASTNSGDDPHRKSRSLEVGSSSNSEGGDSSVGLEHEINVVDKNVVGDETARRSVGNLPVPVLKNYTDDAEVVREIKLQFEKACESAEQVSRILEVGKQPYQQKSSPLKATVRMICGLPSLSASDEDLLKFEEEIAISSTLQKLYVWEKKLLEEVKMEEKMRVLYDRKCQELRHLDEKGAEVHKIEATQAFIRKLSTRISIAIQIVNSISTKISKLRDEELWPQICEFVQGFMRMWAAMSECHRIQSYAISAAKNLDAILSFPRLSDLHLDYTKELEIALLDWMASFTEWVAAQRKYIKTLNAWLVKGLNYVEEVTEDGPIPFSPGRLGAPPIFVICNQWSNSMDMIKETEVISAIRDLASNVYQLWGRHRFERRQALMANADGMDRKMKSMDRDEQIMKKEIEIRNRKLESISGAQTALEAVPNTEIGSLQLSLKHVFEALESFTVSLAKVYEDLNARSEEEKERLKDDSKVS
ncbi:hypothetical protein LUZ62_016536 [Rhynchospora pubera]|uniref:Uncharacterized protein n=1 Tax=Rhynchospora pubera TaxID=906938 RepID=A0AAV8GK24_9POAL|nr:hypothetical protein LUZ62_016536 [Rhynchospora pubera]